MKVIKIHFFPINFDAALYKKRRFFQWMPGFIGPKTFFMLKCYVWATKKCRCHTVRRRSIFCRVSFIRGDTLFWFYLLSCFFLEKKFFSKKHFFSLSNSVWHLLQGSQVVLMKIVAYHRKKKLSPHWWNSTFFGKMAVNGQRQAPAEINAEFQWF